MKMNVYVVLGVLLVSAAEAAKILGIFMVPSHSHQMVFQPVWKELSLRGHEVTVYTPNPLNDPTLTNLTEIDLGFSYETFKNFSSANFKMGSKIEETKHLFNAFAAVFEAQMSSPELQKLLANENKDKYDLFLVEFFYPTMYPFKDVFNCPMVGITSLPLTTGAAENMGMVKHPALDPDFLMTFATDLTFKERVLSTLMYIAMKVNTMFKMGPELTALARKYFGENTRDVAEIAREVSVVLGNFNFVTQNVRPQVPNFVEIAGMHLHPPKPLPKDLKKFLDDSDEGVVYFSLGSNVKSSLLPETTLNKILAAFSELQYKVLFKFERDGITNLSSIPSNVEIRKWVPQQDLLRHPNVKLFVTQGGLQSIDESLSAKVPMLVMPFFGDQDFNAHKLVKMGAALSIHFNDFTKDELVSKINQLIQDPKYKKTVSDLGEKAFDQQVPPVDKAVWWIEYVLRHNGADHLRYKGVNMPSYQFYLLDVFGFLIAVSAVTLYGLTKITKKLITGVRFVNQTWKSNSSTKKSQ